MPAVQQRYPVIKARCEAREVYVFPLGILFFCKIGKYKCLTLINNPLPVWYLHKKKYKVVKVKVDKQPKSIMSWQQVSQPHKEGKKRYL